MSAAQQLAAAPDTPLFTYKRPRLYPKQRRALFCPERVSVIEASPKVGKTFGSMVWLFEQGMTAPDGANLWWCAPVLGTAKIAYRRYKRFLPKSVFKANDSELTLTLFMDNARDLILWFKSGDNPDLLYGDDVWAAVIDEATRFKTESWYAVRTTLSATRGKYRIIGNVKGQKNWAYQLARMAEAEMAQAKIEGRPATMHYAKLIAADAIDAGILSQEDINEARAVLPEHVFRELYMAEPSEDGGNPFGIKHIEACHVPVQSKKKPVVYGLDLASKEDWTVLIGLDEDGVEAYFDRWQGPWTEVTPRVSNVVGSVPCLVDQTGVGDVKLADLQMWGGQNFSGKIFTQNSKQQMMVNISLKLQQRKTAFASDVLRAELDAMEYQITKGGGTSYGAPSGMHDDAVMAYALALWLLNDLYPGESAYYVPGSEGPSLPERPNDDYGTEEGGFYVPMGTTNLELENNPIEETFRRYFQKREYS